MRNYTDIAKLSPYPIYVESLDDSNGTFCHRDFIDFEPCIQLDKNLSDVGRYATLLHEITHARHYKRNCMCYRSDSFYRLYLRELHAFQFPLRFALRYKMIDVLKYLHHHLTCDGVIYWPKQHQEAIREIKTQKIWKKVEKMLDIQ